MKRRRARRELRRKRAGGGGQPAPLLCALRLNHPNSMRIRKRRVLSLFISTLHSQHSPANPRQRPSCRPRRQLNYSNFIFECVFGNGAS